MQTQYKYIHFENMNVKGKLPQYICLNNTSGAILAVVKWYSPWRQYCFFPLAETIFNTGCLDDVKDFIRQLMEERKRIKKLYHDPLYP